MEALILAQQGQASWIAGMTKLCVLVNGMRRELRRDDVATQVSKEAPNGHNT